MAAEDIINTLLDIVVSLYIILILLVLPLYFQDGFNHIGSDKSYFFRQVSFKLGIIAYALLAIYILIRLIAGVIQKTVKKMIQSVRLSVTDMFVLIYGAGVIASYFCSEYRDEALLGAEKWYMGTLPQLAFVSVYFFISRYWKIHKWILAAVLPVTFAVFVLGVLNRFGIYPIDMKIENSAFISTVGNINWYCGYAVTVFFAALGYFWLNEAEGIWGKSLSVLYMTAGFATMVTQGSDSGIVAMAVVLAVMFIMSSDREKLQSFGLIISILAAVCVFIGIVGKCTPLKSIYEKCVTEYPVIRLLTGSSFTIALAAAALVYLFWVKLYICGEKGSLHDGMKNAGAVRKTAACFLVTAVVSVIAFTIANTLLQGKLTAAFGETAEKYLYFNNYWGSGRGASFRAAVICFSEQNTLHKLLGVGADCMSAYIYSERSERAMSLVTEMFGTLRLTNAHSEWLTLLVNQGIIGLTGFAGIICSAVYRYLGRYKKNIFAAICGLGILAYSVNNIVSFQTSINTPTMFVLLGIGECFIRQEKR